MDLSTKGKKKYSKVKTWYAELGAQLHQVNPVWNPVGITQPQPPPPAYPVFPPFPVYPTVVGPLVRPLVPAVPPAPLQLAVPYAPQRPIPSADHLAEIQKLVDKQTAKATGQKPPVTGLGILQDIHQIEQSLRYASKELRDLREEIFNGSRDSLSNKVRDGLLCAQLTLSGAEKIVSQLQDIVDDVQSGNREFRR